MERFGRRAATVAWLVGLAATIGCGSKDSAQPTADPAVLTMNVAGPQSPLNVGSTAQLTATAVFADGSTRVVTSTAAWSTSNATIATVGPTGLVTAIALGDAEIRASYRSVSGTQAISVVTPTSGLSCGVERWPVKTLSDANAGEVNFGTVQTVTIKELNQQPVHCTGIPSVRTFPQEFVLYETTGRITFARFEDDRDYHVALADLSEPVYTIVTEVADPNCNGAIQSAFRSLLVQARSAFDSLRGTGSLSSLIGTTVRVRGVGFYDFNHGQTGRSQSCMELHPLTSIERVQRQS